MICFILLTLSLNNKAILVNALQIHTVRPPIYIGEGRGPTLITFQEQRYSVVESIEEIQKKIASCPK